MEVFSSFETQSLGSALLWDLDNVAPGLRHLVPVAALMGRLVEPTAPRVAAGHRRTFRACRPLLTDSGVEVWSGGRRPSGADRVLLRRAVVLREDGMRRFVVASNDGIFSEIAKYADLYVVTLDPSMVSVRLFRRARGVIVLARHNDVWEAW
jgi:hypothetical protein